MAGVYRRLAHPSTVAALAVMGIAGGASAYTGVWTTSWTCEENPPASCADDTVMTGLACSGSYCDNNRGTCRNTSRELLGNYWTAYKSEEDPYNLCNAGYFVTGFDCQGQYCDNKSLECTRLENASHSACQWVGPFSEEAPINSASCPAGKFMAGTFCSGSNCDNQYIYCCTP